MSGASSAQEQLQQSQMNFYNTLSADYSQTFGQNQAILKSLTSSFEPILQAGINQQGFSPAELNTLNSTAVTGSGQAYASANKAVNDKLAAEGGGNSYIPSGAKTQLNEELASSAAQNVGNQELGIEEQNYATGRSNYLEAAGILGGVAGQYNPTGYAGAATGAGSAAETTANQINQENNSWVNAVVGGLSGAASSAATAYSGYEQCWIAAAIFDGWDGPKTNLVRNWLITQFKPRWYGKPIMWLYRKIGLRVSKQPILVSLLRPLFIRVLEKAQ